MNNSVERILTGQVAAAREYKPFFPEISNLCSSVPDILQPAPPLYPKKDNENLSVSSMCAPVSTKSDSGSDVLANIDAVNSIVELRSLIAEENETSYVDSLNEQWKLRGSDPTAEEPAKKKKDKGKRFVKGSDVLPNSCKDEFKAIRVNYKNFETFSKNRFCSSGSFSYLSEIPFSFNHMNCGLLKLGVPKC